MGNYQDGCWSTIEGACTVVRDFTDFCFHSYFSYMDELSEEMLREEKPIDIKLETFLLSGFDPMEKVVSEFLICYLKCC